MWDCLVSFSTWAEGNSGQIQIVIALLALWLAAKAYKGLLIQLNDSNTQKAFDLKVKIIDDVLQSTERNTDNTLEFYKVVDEYNSVKAKLKDSNSKELIKVVDDLDSAIDGAIKTTNGYIDKNDELFSVINKLKDKKIRNVDQLENLWKLTIELRLGDAKLSHMPREIEMKLQKIIKLIPKE